MKPTNERIAAIIRLHRPEWWRRLERITAAMDEWRRENEPADRPECYNDVESTLAVAIGRGIRELEDLWKIKGEEATTTTD